MHFHCDSKKLRKSCYMVSFGKFYPHFILEGDSTKELAFRYSMIPYEKYYTKTERLVFKLIENEWKLLQEEH